MINWKVSIKILTRIKQSIYLFENEINRLKKFSKDYIAVKYLFKENGNQNYLVFQLMSKYFKVPNNKN